MTPVLPLIFVHLSHGFGHAVVEVVVLVVVLVVVVVVVEVTQPLFPVGQAYISYVVPVSELDILSTP